MYAPVYRTAPAEVSDLTGRTGQLKQKRRRVDSNTQGDDSDGEEDERHVQGAVSTRQQGLSLPTSSTDVHPITRTDPYHVAGYSREEPSLPPPPYPHAAIRTTGSNATTLAGELASLELQSKLADRGSEASLKRRHVDNLTTILHTCMLRQDWDRASRAWALLLRTEIEGKGMDVRRHERWKVGAELLMRRNPVNGQPHTEGYTQHREGFVDSEASQSERPLVDPVISDEGFRLARQYYERLILQYPHNPRSQNMQTSLIFYPALFNIWIYEVQARSRRALAAGDLRPSATIRAQELAEALPIAERMDELLVTPEFDISAPLLQLRGMVALWLSDLSHEAADATIDADDGNIIPLMTRGQTAEEHAKADREKRKAVQCFALAKTAGALLPKYVDDLLAESSDAAMS